MLSPWASTASVAGAVINPYIWCLVGASLGWLAGSVAGKITRTSRIEDVLVGVFGAFIGGEAVANAVRGPVAGGGFTISGLALAATGAVTMLVVLWFLRRAVGPLRPGTSRVKRR
jgi:uncharacterized membrane protein YeaQ/YmgE (transglycosylase-associated protein family)